VRMTATPRTPLSGQPSHTSLTTGGLPTHEATPDASSLLEGASLSPSRAADFKTCPLLYRFRAIDKLPERPTPEQARGTLVHAVLERLFDLPASERTLEQAITLLPGEWERLRVEQPDLVELFTEEADWATWLESARPLLASYFTLEDPRRLEPAARELMVEAVLDGGLRIRGIIDRLDVAPNGQVRVVDYKTGTVPRQAFEGRALFQLKFYALVLWRTRGVVPRVLRLLYLRESETLDYTPDEAELVRFERTLRALWQAIERAIRTQDFRPAPSRLCDWCAHRSLCPAHGGTPPPFPDLTLGMAL